MDNHPCLNSIKCEHTACIGQSCAFHPSHFQPPSYHMKVRCPVCNGTGAVDPSFASGFEGSSHPDTPGVRYFVAGTTGKICPACNGTGMQEVTVTVP